MRQKRLGRPEQPCGTRFRRRQLAVDSDAGDDRRLPRQALCRSSPAVDTRPCGVSGRRLRAPCGVCAFTRAAPAPWQADDHRDARNRSRGGLTPAVMGRTAGMAAPDHRSPRHLTNTRGSAQHVCTVVRRPDDMYRDHTAYVLRRWPRDLVRRWKPGVCCPGTIAQTERHWLRSGGPPPALRRDAARVRRPARRRRLHARGRAVRRRRPAPRSRRRCRADARRRAVRTAFAPQARDQKPLSGSSANPTSCPPAFYFERACATAPLDASPHPDTR